MKFVAVFVEISCTIYASVIWHVIRNCAATYYEFRCVRFFNWHSIDKFTDTI